MLNYLLNLDFLHKISLRKNKLLKIKLLNLMYLPFISPFTFNRKKEKIIINEKYIKLHMNLYAISSTQKKTKKIVNWINHLMCIRLNMWKMPYFSILYIFFRVSSIVDTRFVLPGIESRMLFTFLRYYNFTELRFRWLPVFSSTFFVFSLSC